MNNIQNNINNNENKEEEKKRQPSFLTEFGEGKTEDDEIIKNLISTCEEGIDYKDM